MLKTEKKVIKEVTYIITEMPSTKGWPIFLKLSKYLTQPIVHTITLMEEVLTSSRKKASNPNGTSEKENNNDILIKACTEVVKHISPDDLGELTVLLLDPMHIQIEKNNQPHPFHMDSFGSDYGALINLTVNVIKINYASFFLDLPDLIEEHKNEKLQEMLNPQT